MENLNPAFGVIDPDYGGLYGQTAAECTIKVPTCFATSEFPAAASNCAAMTG